MTDDQPRPAATSRDDYSLTIDEVATRYEAAGHPRIKRHPAALLRQRSPRLRATGNPFRRSVSRHTGIGRSTHRANRGIGSHGQPRRAGADRDRCRGAFASRYRRRSRSGRLRRTAAGHGRRSLRDAARIRKRVPAKRKFRQKTTQIAALLERDHETNALINGLAAHARAAACRSKT